MLRQSGEWRTRMRCSRLAWWCVRRPTRSSAVVGIALLASCSVSQEKPLELRVDEVSTAIGDYRVEEDPTLRGATSVFGEPSQCRILPVTKFSSVRWKELGLRMEFGSYGSYPRGGNACTSRANARLSRVYIRGARWRTSRGLRIGDTQQRLTELYPYANHVRATDVDWAGADPERWRGWWLVVRVTHLGEFHAYPALLATTKRGRVSEFVVHVGAEGD